MKTISRFHYLTQDMEGFSHARLAELACLGGASWVQLRVKNKPTEDWLKIAMETKRVCEKYKAKLIVNDNIHIAKEICAEGVHLGKEDMSPAEARQILGNRFIIGGSANTIEDVKRQINNGCDYIGLGPFRFTTTKEKLNPFLGLDGIRRIISMMKNVSTPIIAIGGIHTNDVESLMGTGIHGIAVSAAINCSPDRSAMTKKFCSLLKHYYADAL